MTKPLRVAYIRRFADAEIIAAMASVPGVEPVSLSRAEAEAGGLQGCDGLIAAGAKDLWTPALGAAVQAAGLRFIQSTTAGHDGIDLYDLPGVAVYGNGGVLGAPVAEHGMAMLLAFVRRLAEAVRMTDEGRWKRAGYPPLLTLAGKTITVVGLGAIGRAAAQRARAFDMQVFALRRESAEDPAADRCFSYAQMREAFGQTDVVFLAAPLTPDTFRLLNAESLAWLKPGAIVVNVGRGDLICTEALTQALHSGDLGGACLDVTAPEPLPDGHLLWRAPNVLISPHVAGGSDRMAADIAARIAAHLQALTQGQAPAHVIRAG